MVATLTTCTLEAESGLTDDSAQNTFVAQSATGTAEDLAVAMHAAVEEFWTYNAGPSGLALGEYISPAISRAAGGTVLRTYDISAHLAGSNYGSPIVETSFQLPDVFGASKALPAEVCLAMTLRGMDWEDQPIETPDGGDAGTAVDRPRQRRTGRLFIGPLTVNAQSEEAVVLRSRPTTNFTNTLFSAAGALVASLDADGNWSVWSRTNGVVYPIERVEVDNAWDIMRSRGNAPTVRQFAVV